MYSALIVAGGSGKRSGLPYNKVIYPINGKPMILYSVDRFREDPDCEEIIVVCPNKEIDAFLKILEPGTIVVPGGKTRQESVFSGLTSCSAKWVFIHDGARPNLRKSAIDNLKIALLKYTAAALGLHVKETLKSCENQIIIGDINRENTYSMQTPQAFLTKEILAAHRQAIHFGNVYPDDTSVYQHELAKPVWIEEGYDENLKATTKIDIMILEALL